jgi:hypothetical protein
MPSQPRRVTTTPIRWPLAEVHCATHERQLVCNPMPKTQTQTPKTATEGYPNGGGHPIGWTWQPSPMSTTSHPTFTNLNPNCSRGGSQNGNEQRPYHHRRGGLVWTTFFLVTWLNNGKPSRSGNRGNLVKVLRSNLVVSK